MPRDIGTGLYHYPAGTEGNTAQTIFSARYNTFINDLANTLNQSLPVNMGGTGADNATEARDNLDAERSMQVVTDFDGHVWEAGSFYAAAGATSAPVAGHAFAGIAYGPDANYFVVEARDLTDTAIPGRLYVREKDVGVWGPWTLAGSTSVVSDGEGIAAMTGDMWYGVRSTAPTSRFAVNSESDLTGNDWFTVSRSGFVDVGTDTVGAYGVLRIRCPPGIGAPVMQGVKGGKLRWHVELGDGTVESGGNIGSNFKVAAYDDAGAGPIGTPFTIARSNGTATFTGDVLFASTLNANGFKASADATNNALHLHTASNSLFVNRSTQKLNIAKNATIALAIDAADASFERKVISTVGKLAANVNSGTASVQCWNNSGGGAWGMWVTNSTLLGFGTTNGSGEPVTQFMRTDGTNFTVSTGAFKPGGGPWTDSSDERIKNVLGNYDNGLEAILQLQPVRFTFKGNDTPAGESPSNKNVPPPEDPTSKDDVVVPYANSPHVQQARSAKEFVGLIAQAAEIPMPEMVSRRNAMIDGQMVSDMRDLDTTPLIFALVNACKELAARIEALEAAQAPP